MILKEIIESNQNDVAFIVGNGINRYKPNPNAVSWDDLLLRLWKKFVPNIFDSVPKGITITEFYDLLDLAQNGDLPSPYEIQKEAARILGDASSLEHHVNFVKKAKELKTPVLTTNFDLILPSALNLEAYIINSQKFTDFYPWTTYYGDQQLQSPTDDFGIWFINGLVKYPRSIRLGLSHYMGSVQRARPMLHGNGGDSLFLSKDNAKWPGYQSWLHILFNKSLCMFGLGLEENEVFMRWLLLERAKYFKKFPDRKKKGWYVSPKNEKPIDHVVGKKYFLESIGFKIVETESYKDIYEDPWI